MLFHTEKRDWAQDYIDQGILPDGPGEPCCEKNLYQQKHHRYNYCGCQWIMIGRNLEQSFFFCIQEYRISGKTSEAAGYYQCAECIE